MDEHPKPRPTPPRPHHFTGWFAYVACACNKWSGAGYGMGAAQEAWERHADVDGCTSFHTVTIPETDTE